MIESYNELREQIVLFFEARGLDIVYVTGGFVLVLATVAARKARNWKRLDPSEQFLLKAVFFTAAVIIVVGILHFFGVYCRDSDHEELGVFSGPSDPLGARPGLHLLPGRTGTEVAPDEPQAEPINLLGR